MGSVGVDSVAYGLEILMVASMSLAAGNTTLGVFRLTTHQNLPIRANLDKVIFSLIPLTPLENLNLPQTNSGPILAPIRTSLLSHGTS